MRLQSEIILEFCAENFGGFLDFGIDLPEGYPEDLRYFPVCQPLEFVR